MTPTRVARGWLMASQHRCAESQTVAQLSLLGQLLWERLVHDGGLDEWGLANGDPEFVRLDCLARTTPSTKKLISVQLDLLVSLGMLFRYEVAGATYIASVNHETYAWSRKRNAPRLPMTQEVADTRRLDRITPDASRRAAQRVALMEWGRRWGLHFMVDGESPCGPGCGECESRGSHKGVTGDSHKGVTRESRGSHKGVTCDVSEVKRGEERRGVGAAGVTSEFPNSIRIWQNECPLEIQTAIREVSSLAPIQATRNMGIWTPEVIIPSVGNDLPLDLAAEVFIAAHCLDLIREDRSKRRPFYQSRRNRGEVPSLEAVGQVRKLLGYPPLVGATAATGTPIGGPATDAEGRVEWECLLCGTRWWDRRKYPSYIPPCPRHDVAAVTVLVDRPLEGRDHDDALRLNDLWDVRSRDAAKSGGRTELPWFDDAQSTGR